MYMGRILYINHDNPQPSGGVQVIYDHVRHLVQNGYEAYVVHGSSNFTPDWFDTQVPVLFLDQQFQSFPGDLIIIPEDYAGLLEYFKGVSARKLIFCQNHFYLFEGMQENNTLSSFGISGVITCSDVATDFVRTYMEVPQIYTVHNAISEHFKPANHKKLQVAYMPRKRPLEARFIRRLCQLLVKSDLSVTWVPIDKMPQQEVARTLGESSIFLALNRLEGFGLPPLEAMASGCLVVGFTGFGGRDYATPDNGFWCDEDNLIGCANQLHKALQMLAAGTPETRRMRANGLKTAAGYSAQRQERELLTAIKGFICQ